MTVDPSAVPTEFSHPASTIVWQTPCPTCGLICTWMARPSVPQPLPRCDQPTCRVEEVVEK